MKGQNTMNNLTCILAITIVCIWITGLSASAADNPVESKVLPLWCEPVDGNVVWNNNRPIFNSIQNSPVTLSLLFHDYEKITLVDPKLVMELPEGLNILEAVGQRYVGGVFANSTLPTDVTHVQRNGKSYTRYTFSGFAELCAKSSPGSNYFQPGMIVCFDPVTYDPRKEYNVYYQVENGDYKSPEKQIIVKILPPMKKTKLPKIWEGSLFVSGEDINFLKLETAKKVAFKFELSKLDDGRSAASRENPETAHAAAIDDMLRSRGWRMNQALFATPEHFGYSIPNAGTTPFIKPDGSAATDQVCPNSIINNQVIIDAYIEKNLRPLPIKDGEDLWIDIEPFKSPEDACFCKNCIAGFSAHSGIELSKLADPQVILKTYRIPWVRYQAHLQGECIGIVAKAGHKAFPKSKVGIYDYINPFESPEAADQFATWCTLSPVEFDKYVDMHGFSLYSDHGVRMLKLLDNARKALKAEIFFYPSIARAVGIESTYTPLKDVKTPNGTRVEMIACAATSAKGMVIYPGRYIDGMFFKTIGRAVSEIAILEDYYYKGTRCDDSVDVQVDNMPNWKDSIASRAHQLGNKTLVTIVNFSADKTAYAKLSYKQKIALTAVDPISGKVLTKGTQVKWTPSDFTKNFVCKVPAEGVGWVLLRPYSKSDESLPKTDIQPLITASSKSASTYVSVRKEIAKRTGSIQASLKDKELNPAKLHDLSISKDGTEFVIESPVQKIWVSTKKGGQIVKWLIKKDNTLVCPNASYSQNGDLAENMCADWFYNPQSLKDKNGTGEYHLISAGIQDSGEAILTLGMLRDDTKVYIEKSYSIGSTESVEVKISVQNLTEENLNLSYWSHNCPKMSIDTDFGKQMVFIVPTAEGLKTYDNIAEHAVFPARDVSADKTGFPTDSIKSSATEGYIIAYLPASKKALRADIDINKLLQFYVCVDKNGKYSTVEWMYKGTDIKPLAQWNTTMKWTYLPEYE